MYWRNGTRNGALAGLSLGFLVWTYTLMIPAFAQSGWVSVALIEQGPFGIELLKPLQLFGLKGIDQTTHAMIWSMLGNVGAYVLVSLLSRQSSAERIQATLFVDVLSQTGERTGFWRGTASAASLQTLVGRFLGPARAAELFDSYARSRGVSAAEELDADARLVRFAELQLAGAIGASSARAMVSSVVQEEPMGVDEVMAIIDEASQAIAHSQELEEKQAELEAATRELRSANARLTELDRLKDDFISTVTHELRTPLTSIRAFSEILRDNPELSSEERYRFLEILVKESERLTRLINQVLDLAKIESGAAEWQNVTLDLREIVNDAVNTTSQLFKVKNVKLVIKMPTELTLIVADRDRLLQVMLNLLSNAIKFCDAVRGQVVVTVSRQHDAVQVDVSDNGIGIAKQDQEFIFEKFRQVGDALTEKPPGTGLGLAICREIVNHFGGRLWVESGPSEGATFSFSLPIKTSMVFQ